MVEWESASSSDVVSFELLMWFASETMLFPKENTELSTIEGFSDKPTDDIDMANEG